MNYEKLSHRVAPWVLPILLLAVWQLSVSAGWLSTSAPTLVAGSSGLPGFQPLRASSHMRLPNQLRQRLSCHGITYGLLLSTATAAGVFLPSSAMAAHYSIAAGPLDSALSQFAARANIILSFSPQQTAQLRSPGLVGDYSVEQGFALLLRESGRQAVVQAPGSYVLHAAPTGELTLAPTTISTYQQAGFAQEIAADVGYKAQNSRIGTKTSTPLSETPRSVSVVTGQRIKD